MTGWLMTCVLDTVRGRRAAGPRVELNRIEGRRAATSASSRPCLANLPSLMNGWPTCGAERIAAWGTT